MNQTSENHQELEMQIRDELGANTDGLLFKPLTQEEREGLKRMVHRTVEHRLERLGIVRPVRIVCDESNNTPEDIENGVINVSIVPEVERVVVEFFVVKDNL